MTDPKPRERPPTPFAGDMVPITLAQEAGLAEYKMPGFLYYGEMQVNHTLRCLHDMNGRARSTYDDRGARLRRHTLLTGPLGVAKSSMARKFLTNLACARSVVAPQDSDLPVGYRQPTFLEVDGDSITWESIRGSASPDGRFMRPKLRGIDYIFASEMTNFLGTDKATVQKRCRALCRALEEGQMVVSLVKFANASKKAIQKFQDELAGTGIHYNEEEYSIWYDADFSMIGCTTPLTEEDNYDYIDKSGLMSRYSNRQLGMSEEEERRLRISQFGRPDAGKERRLRDFNLHAFNCRVRHVDYPPDEMVQDVIKFYHEWYKIITDESGLSIGKIANPRDNVDAAQLLTARAATRALWKAYQDGSLYVESIEYLPKDVEWVKQYRIPTLERMHTDALLQSETDSLESVEAAIVAMVRRSGQFELFGPDIIAKLGKDLNLPVRTAYRRIGSLRKRGSLISIPGRGRGWHRVGNHIIERSGVPVVEEGVPEGVDLDDHQEPELPTDEKRARLNALIRKHGLEAMQ